MKNKGFTLIELLVVIAIIGLLFSIVLVYLRTTQDRARDAKVISDMIQFRNQAEIKKEKEGSYNSVNCVDDSFSAICADIKANNGNNTEPDPEPKITPNTNKSEYCAYATLLTKEGGATRYWCVDSRLNSIKINSVSSCENTANPRCQ
jgi:prepilin-type N-terminal cleavage/methylation domain-containing protein